MTERLPAGEIERIRTFRDAPGNVVYLEVTHAKYARLCRRIPAPIVATGSFSSGKTAGLGRGTPRIGSGRAPRRERADPSDVTRLELRLRELPASVVGDHPNVGQ